MEVRDCDHSVDAVGVDFRDVMLMFLSLLLLLFFHLCQRLEVKGVNVYSEEVSCSADFRNNRKTSFLLCRGGQHSPNDPYVVRLLGPADPMG
jgi:hypothetical protein